MIPKQFQSIDPFVLNHLINDFRSITTIKSFPKHFLLHEEGTICNELFFIEKGIARSYYHKDGKDITAHFALENEAITAIDSFIQRKKSRYNIEILEEAVIYSMTHQAIDQLLALNPQYEKFIRLFLEHIYIDLAERIEDLLFYNAKERYDNLMQKNPSLDQRVNLGHIASYIGVTQETLSRIRASK
ncbi:MULTISPECIES: Crp/Fnr family transcriptional regulator [unclassified Aureispira]|uniref:Crp/Fnr family transcriptional regulator n=1 Tax=unclassified Aureispira TaxID=2649989 RepID=UPI000698158D|nr:MULTISPECIES: Crp/Fnr family transcriptional regulator [unclassified Aureispira]WMX16156.1 Crp/Fnr family transcriptional regulator [Aureispira sp. CCB-E]